MRETTFYTDPQVLFLSQVLEDLHRGTTEIPRFQRPLVWDWDQRVELLRSVREGIPMGAIMVWRTSLKTMDSFHEIGPFRLAPPPSEGPRQYLLDGVQRLTTLYGALYDLTDLDNPSLDDRAEYSVFFHLERNEFINGRDFAHRDEIPNVVLPLAIVLDSVALIRFQRRLPEHADDLVAKVDEIAGAFRNYKVPIIPVTTDDLELVTRTFQKINSQGAAMNEAHMLQALTWRQDFDLRDRLSELRDEYLTPLGWGDLDDEEILRSCKVAAELDLYEPDIESLSTVLRRTPEALLDAVCSIASAVNFLKSECYVPSQMFLPYSLQLTMLAEAFRLDPTPDDNFKRELTDWFYMSSYGELFRGMSGYRLQRTISDIRDGVLLDRIGWSGHKNYDRLPLRSSFDLRAARAKAMIILLARRYDRFFPNKAFELLANMGKAAIGQIVMSRAHTRAQGVSGPANRILCRPQELGELRTLFLDELVPEEQLMAHLISGEAHLALINDHPDEFLEARFRDLVELEDSFMGPIEQRFLSRA